MKNNGTRSFQPEGFSIMHSQGFKEDMRPANNKLMTNTMIRSIWIVLLICIPLWVSGTPAFKKNSYDLLVYGATPAGISSAVSAAREGLEVAIVEESDRIGGMVAGGMSNTDFKSFESVQGFYKEFMDAIVAYYEEKYGPGSQQVKDCYRGAWYEPHVALEVFQNFIHQERSKITLYMQHRLVKALVKEEGQGKRRLYAADFQDLKSQKPVQLTSRVFVDATYEGDLMASAGVSYTVGRESRFKYGERWAGRIYFKDRRLQLGSTGEGDKRVQCYNFRICMSKDPGNRIPIEKPANYDRSEFIPLLEKIQSGEITKIDWQIIGIRGIPNNKADFNDKLYSPVSLRLMGENDEWPEGDPATRRRIFNRFKDYSLGLIWFLQNDPELPKTIRDEALQWGLPKDEFQEYGNFPPFLYVREARRMVGDYVFIEPGTQRAPGAVRAVLNTRSIAINDYSMDSHGVAPPDAYYPDVTEGAFNYYVLPYQIPYDVIVPANVEGLLVPVCVSASHVAFCSIRMEPTWTALGQAAGIAAALSLQQKVSLEQVEVLDIQGKLHQKGAVTFYVTDVLPGHPAFEAAQYFGTRGFFHSLISSDSVAFEGRGEYLIGQWHGPHPHHQVGVDQIMDNQLAAHWNELAGQKLDHKNKTRGQFLIELYDLLKSKQELGKVSEALAEQVKKYSLDKSFLCEKR